MALFYVVLRKYSVSLLNFPFLSHVQIISIAISPVCSLKYPYSCFSFNFCFLVFVVFLLILVLLLLLLAVVNSLSLHFLMYFSSH